jgi:hypothetical protein
MTVRLFFVVCQMLLVDFTTNLHGLSRIYYVFLRRITGISRIVLTTKRSSPPEGAKGNFSNVISRKSGESWKLNNLAPVYFYFIIYFIDSIDLRETLSRMASTSEAMCASANSALSA